MNIKLRINYIQGRTYAERKTNTIVFNNSFYLTEKIFPRIFSLYSQIRIKLIDNYEQI